MSHAHEPSSPVRTFLKLRVGYELTYDFPQPTPLIGMLNVHYTRVGDLAAPDHLKTVPSVPISGYRDMYGNWCSRLLAPAGRMSISTDAIISDSGFADEIVPDAARSRSRCCLKKRSCFSCRAGFVTATGCRIWPGACSGRLSRAGGGFRRSATSPTSASLSAIISRRVTRTASEAYQEGQGVCRDYAHLAVAFCRALNIPARYCTGYLGDVGMEPPYPPGDFAAWFEVYLGGKWRTFDARNNEPRIGRVLIARGRDAADVPITTTFGPNTLAGFRVWTDEV